MLNELYKKAKQENADMVICDYFTHFTSGIRYNKQCPSSLDASVVLCELFQQLHGSCWNKLVRRACYNKFGVRFPTGVAYCEDLLTNATLLTHDIRVAYLNKAFYHYDNTSNTNSIVSQCTLADFHRNEHLLALMCEALRGTPAEPLGAARIGNSLLRRCFRGRFFTSREFRRHCRKYINYCFVGSDKFFCLFLYISCLGAYRLAYNSWEGMRKIKHTIRK